jgi:signal transduction histidine kinase
MIAIMVARGRRSRSGVRLWPDLSVASRLRVGTALLCLVVATAAGHAPTALVWVLAACGVEVVADRARHRVSVLVVEGALVVGAVAATIATTSALLPLLLLPAFRSGEVFGRAVAARTGLALLAAPVAAAMAAQLHQEPMDVAVTATAQWWVLACGLAFLSAWNRRVESDRHHPEPALAREAGLMLGRLRDVALALPAGLDAPAVGHILLERLKAEVPADRAGVLAHVGPDQVSPLALRGVDRFPWRNPVDGLGTVRTAWVTRSAVLERRLRDEHGRRRGSALMCLPLADREDELLGLVVLERLGEAPFTREELEAAKEVTYRMVPHLHAALAFTELRHVTEVTERERLAREMHNGVAQELAALGFSIDMLTRRARHVDGALAAQSARVRDQLNRTISDIRLSIADLRSSAHPDRGLSAAVSSHVEALAAATGKNVTLSLRESTFRLPPHVESALLRLVQDFLADVRAQPDVRQVKVELSIDAPEARIALHRLGGSDWTPDRQLVAELESSGGAVQHLRSADGASAVLLQNVPGSEPAAAVVSALTVGVGV